MKRLILLLALVLPFCSLAQYKYQLEISGRADLLVHQNHKVKIIEIDGLVHEGVLHVFNDSVLVGNNVQSYAYSSTQIEVFKKNGKLYNNKLVPPAELRFLEGKYVIPLNKVVPIIEIKLLYCKRREIDPVTLVRRVDLSMALMGYFTNTKQDLFNGMTSSDLHDLAYGINYSFLFGMDSTRLYPKENEASGATFDFELRIGLKGKHNLVLNYGNVLYTSVSGFKELFVIENSGFWEHEKNSYGNLLRVNVSSKAFTVAYGYTLLNQRVMFSVGPTCIPIEVSSNTGQTSSQISFGFFGGASINVFHRKWWFLSFKCRGSLVPPINIGPYEIDGEDNQGRIITSRFEETKINISSFSIGCGIGLRF